MLDRSLTLCLQAIDTREGEIRAWVEVAPQSPIADGPLSGLCFGAKDIFETRGLATEFGSPLYAGRKSETDAAVVTELRRIGATLIGKTATAAFAYFDPPSTNNPRWPGHTPGGSSSGSAAAVAAGMAGFALGTQTMGSVIRPASFCGITGFKPSYGLLSTQGVLSFAPSLDTIGIFTEKPADMHDLWTRWHNSPKGAVHTHFEAWDCDATIISRLRDQGFTINTAPVPQWWIDTGDAARLVNDYEGARTHHERYAQFGPRIGLKLHQLVERGLRIPESAYHDALSIIEVNRPRVTNPILTPAAPGPPPATLTTTGDPHWNAPWTALGVPVISIPNPTPVGLQLAMPRHAELDLLSTAAAFALQC